jgi:hypothetical protein
MSTTSTSPKPAEGGIAMGRVLESAREIGAVPATIGRQRLAWLSVRSSASSASQPVERGQSDVSRLPTFNFGSRPKPVAYDRPLPKARLFGQPTELASRADHLGEATIYARWMRRC